MTDEKNESFLISTCKKYHLQFANVKDPKSFVEEYLQNASNAEIRSRPETAQILEILQEAEPDLCHEMKACIASESIPYWITMPDGRNVIQGASGLAFSAADGTWFTALQAREAKRLLEKQNPQIFQVDLHTYRSRICDVMEGMVMLEDLSADKQYFIKDAMDRAEKDLKLAAPDVQKEKKDLCIRFRSGLLGKPFVTAKGVELVSISIPNKEKDSPFSWRTFVVPAKSVHTDRHHEKMRYLYLDPKKQTTIRQSCCIGKNETGKGIYETHSYKIDNSSLKNLMDEVLKGIGFAKRERDAAIDPETPEEMEQDPSEPDPGGPSMEL